MILKIKKNVLQLQKTISELTSSPNKTEFFKSGDEKLLKEIYEKDQKIELLKDMIKSIKKNQKENSKKKTDDGIDINLQELHPEKFEKSDQDLMNSLAAKCINKFFRMLSLYRSSSDTPPDVSRLLKKLRQDLKLYSAFSIKDLQLSVPQLQLAFTDSKSHITLDELIAVINKVIYL